ncbi:MAG: hypothetical protein AAFU65_03230 [Pseudomonadota bacterium]
MFNIFMAFILFSLGIGFFTGGIGSDKYGMFISAGHFNPHVGIALCAFAAWILWDMLRTRRDP